MSCLTQERLDEVVDALKLAMADEEIRKLSQRAIQGKVWHQQPCVAKLLGDLRSDEDRLRSRILAQISELVYLFHGETLDATLARAGVMHDDRVNAGSSLQDTRQAFDLFCLDSKERLYLALKQYGWLEDFFRRYPLHFYENSFTFVDRIPPKKLPIKVKVVGLGVAGSLAVSGLAKHGISVVGYEKRARSGGRGVTSRYQNASWRAFDIAAKLLDEEAYDKMKRYQQRLNVTYDDGTTGILTSDRVQIILGNAVDTALQSAERYGAEFKYECSDDDFYNETSADTGGPAEVDIVALFAGAHTSKIFPGLEDEMEIYSWSDLDSSCKMWLRIKESEQKEAYCTRGGENGAINWHYTIYSARDEMEDVERIRDNLTTQYNNTLRRLNGAEPDPKVTALYDAQIAQINKILEEKPERFDYIFTNAPDNSHNQQKRLEAGMDNSVVMDGGYTVEIKIARYATVTKNKSPKAAALLNRFSAGMVLTGGDACVPPNPMAAYGATLACEAADMLVQLSVGQGHLNAILIELNHYGKEEWVEKVKTLKDMLAEYYEARNAAETYFQFVQTLICNLYSLPPQITIG